MKKRRRRGARRRKEEEEEDDEEEEEEEGCEEEEDEEEEEEEEVQKEEEEGALNGTSLAEREGVGRKMSEGTRGCRGRKGHRKDSTGKRDGKRSGKEKHVMNESCEVSRTCCSREEGYANVSMTSEETKRETKWHCAGRSRDTL